MQKLKSFDELNTIVGNVFRKGCHTNNFMMLDTYKSYIEMGKLSVVNTTDNVAFLLDKVDYWQLYYYLNALSNPIRIDTDKPVVMEILYRGHNNKPQHLIDYWQKLEYREHLSRDIMMTSWAKLSIPVTNFENIKIRYASSKKELLFAKGLLDDALDHYTGDRLSQSELETFMINNNLLCVFYRNEIAGVLQFEIKNNVVWLGHIAIHSRFRGKGIANALVHDYITLNKSDDHTRYALWVIQDNLPAVNLYKKFGFIYSNKSTVSLLKQT